MKPFSLPKQLQYFSDEQLAELHDWLDDGVTYKDIRQKLLEGHGIKVSDATLSRYSQRRELAEQTVDHSDSAKNIRTFLALQNGEPVPYDEAGLALVQKRAFDAACARKVPVSTLAALQRIFHYKTARAEAERRFKQADQRIALSERAVVVREGELELRRVEKKTKPAAMENEEEDELGPVATNWDEVGERARKAFNISPEESARRAALRRAREQTPIDPLTGQRIQPATEESSHPVVDNQTHGSACAPTAQADIQFDSPFLTAPKISFNGQSDPRPLNLVELLTELAAEKQSQP
jgi:hypothetical protein